MALAEAVLEIVVEMEKKGLTHFARELRLVVKASEGTVVFQTDQQGRYHTAAYNPAAVELTRQLQAAEKAEASLDAMVEMIGGTEHNTLMPVPGTVPVGAKTVIGKQVYVLSPQRKLVYSEEETQKHFGSKSEIVTGIVQREL